MEKSRHLVGGILLVAGTCIGGGMLALPVLTSLGGFIPSVAIYFICWAFMACTGLLFLEACHWMEGDTNIISMAEKTLGLWGKTAAWFVYLFLFFCLTLAYMVGCGNLVSEVLSIPEWAGSLVFVTLFAPFVIAGARVVGKINSMMMLGLGIFYFAFIAIGYQFVNTDLLQVKNWSLSIYSLPAVFISFGYQGVIPSLSRYMQRDVKKIRKAILIGSFIPFLAYVVWEWLILGIVPTYGPGGLVEALKMGQNAVSPLKLFIHNQNVYLIGQFFAFFALTTSFLGVTLGLFDFLADGLHVKKNHKGKLAIAAIVFLPPLAFAMIYPHVFIVALTYAGGYGSSLLLGLLPILMVWSGRYRLGLQSSWALPGGKITLVALLLFVLFEIGFQLLVR